MLLVTLLFLFFCFCFFIDTPPGALFTALTDTNACVRIYQFIQGFFSFPFDRPREIKIYYITPMKYQVNFRAKT